MSRGSGQNEAKLESEAKLETHPSCFMLNSQTVMLIIVYKLKVMTQQKRLLTEEAASLLIRAD